MNNKEYIAMKGKTVLVISVGGYCQRFIFDVYKDYGIEIVLVDPDGVNTASSKVTFIQYDFLDHDKDPEHAKNIISMLKDKAIMVDGCVTFVDTCGPLAATICDLLSLHGPGQNGAEIAKSKGHTYAFLRNKALTTSYIAKCYFIKSVSDIKNAVHHVGLPVVLKPENGCCGFGVKRIETLEECLDIYKKEITTYGDLSTLMEFIKGTQHGVELILFQQKLIAAFVTDYGPTRLDRFTETVTTMPSCLTKDKEDQLIAAAHQCCIGVGLIDGVFNAEMKMTRNGPKLIEINPRMPSFYIRNWVLECYGIDILLYTFMTCLGIKPIITKPEPLFRIMGISCVPSVHKNLLKDKSFMSLIYDMQQKRIIRIYQLSNSVDECEIGEDEIPFCTIAVTDSSLVKVKQNMLVICNTLGLGSKDYDVQYFMKDFKE